jgi:hypothetical protein
MSRKAPISFVMSCSLSARLSACISAAPTGRIFGKFGVGDLYENLSRNSMCSYNLTNISGTLHKDLTVLHIVGSNICNATTQKTRYLFHGNIEYVSGYWKLHMHVINKKGTHCCISMATMVLQTYHNSRPTLYIHFLSCFISYSMKLSLAVT